MHSNRPVTALTCSSPPLERSVSALTGQFPYKDLRLLDLMTEPEGSLRPFGCAL